MTKIEIAEVHALAEKFIGDMNAAAEGAEKLLDSEYGPELAAPMEDLGRALKTLEVAVDQANNARNMVEVFLSDDEEDADAGQDD